jgi:general secretion pathway protein J
LRAAEVAIVPLAGWQLFVHRGGSWTNPLSSDAGTEGSSSTNASTNTAQPPDGVRLMLDLPTPSVVSGRLTLDWVRPTLTGAGS